MSDARYADLREAIRATAFVKANTSVKIVRSEQGGERDEWIFDFRALMLQSKWLNRYAEIFWNTYADHYPFQVGGTETAAICLIAAIVMKGVERGTPVNGFYLRKSRKRQGLMKQIEGTLTSDPIILVDDLCNSGQTLTKQLDILAPLEKKVCAIFVLLAFRDREAYRIFEDRDVSFDALFTLRDFDLPLLSDSARSPQRSFVEQWHFKPSEPSHHLVVEKSAPVLYENTILFGCDDGIFRALDQDTGRIAWEFKVGRHPEGKGILSSPAVYQDFVYFGAYDGSVYALDARSGTKRWEYDDADWIGSSPSIAPELDMLYIGLEFGLFKKRGGVAALDIHSGEEVWRATHQELTHSSPLYIAEESMVIIGSNDGVVYAYHANTGALRWQFQTQGHIKASFAYDAARKLVIFGSMDGKIYVLKASTGQPVFARVTGASIYSTPLVYEDVLYMASLDKHLYAIDLNTWKDLWEFPTNGRIFASPSLHDGSLWIGSNDGRLYEIDPQDGKLRGFFQTTERVTNSIAYDSATARIFVPTSANEMYCIARA